MMEVSVADGGITATPSSAGRRLRIVVLRSDDPHQRYLEVQVARRSSLVGVVVEPGAVQRARLRSQRKWSAWAWRAYHLKRQQLTRRAAYRRGYFAGAGTAGGAAERITVDWINSPQSGEFLARLRPDVLLVCGTSYIRPEVFGTAPVAINVHGGFLPDYKGNHGVFFAFERGDMNRIGASLHLVSAELDAGPLIAVAQPEIFPHDNDEHLYCRSVKAAIDLLCETLCRLESGETITVWPQPPGGTVYRHRDRTPGRELRLWVRRRLGVHRTIRVQTRHTL